MAHYIHNVPGRIRVTLPALRCKDNACSELQAILEGMYGVKDAVVKPVTGSVVVNYDAGMIDGKEILTFLEERGYYNPALAAAKAGEAGSAADKAGHAICRAALGWAVGRALEGNGLSFLAALI
jgi:copper chaperone CopZ